MFEITFHLNETNHVPLYAQLYDYFKVEIQYGQIKSGTKLPSKRKLAAHFGIGLNTVDAAYQQLVAEGYVESRVRKGYYVANIDPIFPSEKQMAWVEEAPKCKRAMIDFNHGNVDVDLFPHSVWKRCLNETLYLQERELFLSSDPKGERELREEIATYLFQSRGVRCVPDQIVLGAGTQYMIHLLRLLLGQKRVMGLEDPGFHRVREVLRVEGAKMRFIPCDENGLSVERLKESDADIAYVTPSHQFPLGMIMPITRRMELLKWAKERKGYIIEDDYDGEFRHEGRPIPSLQGLDASGRVIYLGTFSKSLIPTIRLGYMVLPLELCKLYQEKLHGYKQTIPKLIQETVCLFMKDGHWERHINRMRVLYRKKNQVLRAALEENFPNGVTVIGERSGLHILVQVSLNQSETELIESAAKAGVKVYPTSFYYSVTMNKPTLLLGYGGLSEKEIKEGILLLRKAWV